MNTYPRDEFDEVDESTARGGAYRARTEADPAANRALLAIALAGTLSLLLGGVMYVMSPRLAAPEAQASATPSTSISAEPTPSTNPASVTVEIYNSSAPEGAAGIASKILEAKGYTVSTTGNWTGYYTEASLVNFATGASSEANEIADTLGLPTIVQDFEADKGLVYVVLGADFDLEALAAANPDILAEATATASAPATATASPSAGEDTGAQEGSTLTGTDGQTLYTVDPTTGQFVEATELVPGTSYYVYNPQTASYEEYIPSSQASTDTSTGESSSSEATTAPEAAVRYSYDPETDTFLEDPAGAYIYDPSTGLFTLG